jgi:hypothetical protein
MTALGIYRTLDEPTLLRMQADVLNSLAAAREGRRISSLSGGGKSFGKELMTVDHLRRELVEIRDALQTVNPTQYGRRVRRLHADFSRNTLT